MVIRRQLNINIDSNLLKKIKQKALESEINIGEYVNSILKCYLTNKDLENNNENHLKRINEIEKKLIIINKDLDKLKLGKKQKF
tara:strand:- start:78 stop:329 length:252 start_codon:yes stop_codon:yes gene_type:complete